MHARMEAHSQDSGWHLSEEGLVLCQKECEMHKEKKLTEAALEMDLRIVGKPSLPAEVNKKGQHQVKGPLVLQIMKARNVAVPTTKQHDSSSTKRLLRLQLTDGHTSVSAAEIEGPIGNLSPDTPPGAKVCIKGTTKVVNGILLLTKSNVEVLGGKVEGLHKKWTAQKTIPDNLERTNEDMADGPPQFITFGKLSSRSVRDASGRADSVIKDKLVGHQEATEGALTREKMDLPQSQHPRKIAVDKKEEDEHRLSAQMKGLAITEPPTVDIENIVGMSGVKSRGPRGGKFNRSTDQQGRRTREFGEHNSNSSAETDVGSGRRGRGRGRGRTRREADVTDDYYPLARKETYSLSDYFDQAATSRHVGDDPREENILEDYMYDAEADMYYAKVVREGDDHFPKDKGRVDRSTNRGEPEGTGFHDQRPYREHSGKKPHADYSSNRTTKFGEERPAVSQRSGDEQVLRSSDEGKDGRRNARSSRKLEQHDTTVHRDVERLNLKTREAGREGEVREKKLVDRRLDHGRAIDDKTRGFRSIMHQEKVGSGREGGKAYKESDESYSEVQTATHQERFGFEREGGKAYKGSGASYGKANNVRTATHQHQAERVGPGREGGKAHEGSNWGSGRVGDNRTRYSRSAIHQERFGSGREGGKAYKGSGESYGRANDRTATYQERFASGREGGKAYKGSGESYDRTATHQERFASGREGGKAYRGTGESYDRTATHQERFASGREGGKAYKGSGEDHGAKEKKEVRFMSVDYSVERFVQESPATGSYTVKKSKPSKEYDWGQLQTKGAPATAVKGSSNF